MTLTHSDQHRAQAPDLSWQCLGGFDPDCTAGWCQCHCHTETT